ncbi:hypothetical protein I317_00323 [Kwoniella heveanensis CBS 569]|nr:hypothetical protein I317_00323 [Kwoniella heveanensis CBS 569]
MTTHHKVLITGLNGFVAPHIAIAFLEKGWDVVGTVRTASKRDTVLDLPTLRSWTEDGQLTAVIVEDLISADWSRVLEGVDAIVHAASPFDLTLKTYEEFSRPAIEGTVNLLTAASKVSSIKAVVDVSSTAAVLNVLKPFTDHNGKIYTEDDWQELTEEDAKKEGNGPGHWYCASKKYASLAAQKVKKDTNASWSLTTVCPPAIFGPPIHVSDASQIANATPGTDVSTATLWAFFTGGEDSPLPAAFDPVFVDVRDLAEAIYLGITKRVNGRFLTSNGSYTAQRLVNIARKARPDLKQYIVRGNPEGSFELPEGSFKLDTSKSVKELGLTYRKLEETVVDTIAQFEKLGAYRSKD